MSGERSSGSGARIYLDVDGVLNAVNDGTPQWGWEDAPVRVKANGWSITYSPAVVSLFNELAETPGLEVFWLTTWCHDAPTKLAPEIGLRGETWQVVGYDHWRDAEPKVWWKLPAIREHLDGFTGGVLWIDDDLIWDSAARAWLHENPHVVGLSPHSQVGITRKQGGIIRDFVNRLTREEATSE